MNRPVLAFFPLNKSLNTTFLLSGWSKGDSIAEVESKCDETTDKFWGIIIKLKYSDKTTEEQYLPTKVSNDGVSMNIAYDQYEEATSTTLVVANHANNFSMLSTAKYENGLLTEQTDNTGAKTVYTYDKDRDCVSVKNANQQEIKTKKKRSGDIWIPPGRKTESLLRLAI